MEVSTSTLQVLKSHNDVTDEFSEFRRPWEHSALHTRHSNCRQILINRTRILDFAKNSLAKTEIRFNSTLTVEKIPPVVIYSSISWLSVLISVYLIEKI